jgi:hypothetical protein
MKSRPALQSMAGNSRPTPVTMQRKDIFPMRSVIRPITMKYSGPGEEPTITPVEQIPDVSVDTEGKMRVLHKLWRMPLTQLWTASAPRA